MCRHGNSARLLGCALLLAWTAHLCGAQSSPEAALRQIEGLINQGQYAAAEEALRPLAAADARAEYLLGFALLQLYRYEEAEEALRRAVGREPLRHAWLHALAKALLEQGKNLAAIEILDRAIALEGKADYHFAKAMSALNVGDLDTAEAELESCLAKDGRHAEALYKLGRLRTDRGDDAAGLGPLRGCLAIQPSHLEARFLLGLAASRTGDPAAAAGAFEAVLEKVPGHVGALYNLGQVLIRLDRREEGLERLETFRSMSRLRDEIDFLVRSVKKNPRHLDVRLRLAPLLLEAGRTEDALAELLAARQLDPGRAATYRLLAAAFRRLGREQDTARAEAFARRLEGRGE